MPVLRGNPGLRLALVGDGPLREQLQQAFAGLPVAFMVRAHDPRLVALLLPLLLPTFPPSH